MQHLSHKINYAVLLTIGLQVLVPGQCLVGSLTGAVASQRVAEAFKGWLGSDGNRIDSAYA